MRVRNNQLILSTRIAKFKLTKKDIYRFLYRQQINISSGKRYNIFDDYTRIFFIKKKRFYFFLVKNRRLLRFFYGGMKKKELFKRVSSTRKKKKINFSLHLLFNLELRLNSILYQNLLIPKIKLLKQLILHKYVKINNIYVKGYSIQTKFNDIISFTWDTYTLMIDKRFKIFLIKKLRALRGILNSFFFYKRHYIFFFFFKKLIFNNIKSISFFSIVITLFSRLKVFFFNSFVYKFLLFFFFIKLFIFN